MKLRVLSPLLLLFFPASQFPAGQLAAQATSNAQKFSPPTRTFRFTYNLAVKDIPAGVKRGRVWVLRPADRPASNCARCRRTRLPPNCR